MYEESRESWTDGTEAFDYRFPTVEHFAKWFGFDNSPDGSLLTDAEKKVIEDAGNLWMSICGVVGKESTRDADLKELIVHIHAIQRAVMANAAARAYPEEFRPLGGRVKQKE